MPLMSVFKKRPCTVDMVINYYSPVTGTYADHNIYHGFLGCNDSVSIPAPADAGGAAFNVNLGVDANGVLSGSVSGPDATRVQIYTAWARDTVDATASENYVTANGASAYTDIYAPGTLAAPYPGVDANVFDASYVIPATENNDTETAYGATMFGVSVPSSGYAYLPSAPTMPLFCYNGLLAIPFIYSADLPSNPFWQDFVGCSES